MSAAAKPDPLDTPVESLELSTRTRTCIENEGGMKTLRDVCAWSEREWMRCPNFGRVSLKDLKEALAEYGLELAPDYGTVMPPLTIYDRLQEIEARLDALERR